DRDARPQCGGSQGHRAGRVRHTPWPPDGNHARRPGRPASGAACGLSGHHGGSGIPRRGRRHEFRGGAGLWRGNAKDRRRDHEHSEGARQPGEASGGMTNLFRLEARAPRYRRPGRSDPERLTAAPKRSCDMERIAPKPPMITNRMRIGGVSPAQLTDRLTGLENLLELSSMGVPDVDSHDWKLDITGLVNRSTSITLEELKRLPKRSLETVFVCSGDPRRPTTPLRRVANVRWSGVDLAGLLDRAGVRSEATHLWSYGLDYGQFFGMFQHHYVKDMPLSRLKDG